MSGAPIGRADILTKNYVKNKRMFADAFNYYIYDGKEVIDPNKLYEVDTTEVTIHQVEDESEISVQPAQKMKDVTDNNAVYMLLEIENQAESNYAMPVKIMPGSKHRFIQ